MMKGSGLVRNLALILIVALAAVSTAEDWLAIKWAHSTEAPAGYSPDGRLTVLQTAASFTIVDSSTTRVRFSKRGYFGSWCFSLDSKRLYVVEKSGSYAWIDEFDSSNGALVKSFFRVTSIGQIQMSADGVTIAASTNRFVLIDRLTGRTKDSYVADGNFWEYLSGNKQIIGQRRGTYVCYDLTTRTELWTRPTGDGDYQVSTVPLANASVLTSWGYDGNTWNLRLWSIPLRQLLSIHPFQGQVAEVKPSPNRNKIGVLHDVGNEHHFSIFDAATGALDSTTGLGLDGQLLTFLWSKDGQKVIVFGEYQGPLVFDARTGVPLGSLDQGPGQIQKLSRDGQKGLVPKPDGYAIARTSDGQIIAQQKVQGLVPISWDMSADASAVMLADARGKIVLYDATTGAVIHQVSMYRTDLRQAVLSPDGRFALATGTEWYDTSHGTYPRRLFRKLWLDNGTAEGELGQDTSSRIVICDNGSRFFVDNKVYSTTGLVKVADLPSNIEEISPHGARVLLKNGSIYAVEKNSALLLKQLDVQGRFCLDVSPDWSQVFSYDAGGPVYRIDVKSGLELDSHPASVRLVSLLISPTLPEAAFRSAYGVYGTMSLPSKDSVSVRTPEILTLKRGSRFAGGLGELESIDDRPYQVVGRDGGTAPAIEFDAYATSPVAVPSGLTISLRSLTNTNGLSQKLQLWNFKTGNWDLVDSQTTALAVNSYGSLSTLSATGDLSRFVRQSDRKVKCRITVFRTGTPNYIDWMTKFDLLAWKISK